MAASNMLFDILGTSKFLQGNVIFIVGMAVLIFGFGVIRVIKGFLELYEKYIKNTELRNISKLCVGTNAGTILSEYLERSKETEKFRVVSGINTSPQKAKMLMKVYNLGVIENSGLKAICDYLEPKGNKIEIKVGRIDLFFFRYSLFSMIAFFIMGIITASAFIFQGEPKLVLVGIVSLLLFCLAAIAIGKGHRDFLTLKKVREKLIEKDWLLNPSEKIQFDFIQKLRNVFEKYYGTLVIKVTK